jgi:hypothetical protein
MIERDPSNRLRMTTDEIQLKRSLHCGLDNGLVGGDEDAIKQVARYGRLAIRHRS